MWRMRWTLMCAALLLSGCAKQQAQEPEAAAPAVTPPEALAPSPLDANTEPRIRSFNWNTRIGIATVEGRHELVMAVPDDSLPSGTLVTLVWLDEPQRVTQARILAPRDKPWAIAGQPVEGRAYELQAEGIGAKGRAFAIAVTGDVGAPAMDAHHALIDLDGDGQPETFRQCSSAEGLHFTVWSGTPLPVSRHGPAGHLRRE